jgi:hypothetical protein
MWRGDHSKKARYGKEILEINGAVPVDTAYI